MKKAIAGGARKINLIKQGDVGISAGLLQIKAMVKSNIDSNYSCAPSVVIPAQAGIYGSGKCANRRAGANLLKCNVTLSGMSRCHRHSLRDPCPPCGNKVNPANKKPADFYRRWVTMLQAKACTRPLHDKLRSNSIWLGQGGKIETYLGLNGSKNSQAWTAFKSRLQEKPQNESVCVGDIVESFDQLLCEVAN